MSLASTRLRLAAASTSTRSTSTRTRSTMARSFFKGRRRALILPITCWALPHLRAGRRPAVLSSQQIRRCFRSGQLARVVRTWRSTTGCVGTCCRHGTRNTISCRPSCSGSSRLFIRVRPKASCFPGMRAFPATLAPTKWTNFAPRVGVAYSPEIRDGLLGEGLGRRGQKHGSRGLWHVLQRHSRDFGRHHERLRSLRLRLRQHRRRPSFSEPFVSATTGKTMASHSLRRFRPFGASAATRIAPSTGRGTNLITGDPRSIPATLLRTPKATRLSWERELPDSTF